MQLSLMTWQEVDARLDAGACAMLPIGSTEQHGPMGLIGTDAICAREIAIAAAELCDAIVLPEVAYTPSPFNTGFSGTVSISEDLLHRLLHEVCAGLLDQGFKGVFILNAHGANLDPIRAAIDALPDGAIAVRSWWEPYEVNTIRASEFGEWEGMHATPSEVSITQAIYGAKPIGDASRPPKRLSPGYVAAHAGDKHGPPDEHKAEFPDGRVGSHSALATPEIGSKLLDVAARSIAAEFSEFSISRSGRSS